VLNSERKIGAAVGVLFIIATLAPIMSAAFISSLYDQNYLTALSANESQVVIGALLMLTMIAATVSIPIVMYPILKRHSENLALGYVGARIFEGFFGAVTVLSLLTLLSLSREYVNASVPAVTYFQTSGAMVLAGFNWSSILLDFPFTVGALVFYYLLFKPKLVPRWLSGWGLIAAALWLSTVPLRMFGLLPSSMEVLALPIAVQEMVLAGWLIVKGFNFEAVKNHEQSN
jgi:hypothetical protein